MSGEISPRKGWWRVVDFIGTHGKLVGAVVKLVALTENDVNAVINNSL